MDKIIKHDVVFVKTEKKDTEGESVYEKKFNAFVLTEYELMIIIERKQNLHNNMATEKYIQSLINFKI